MIFISYFLLYQLKPSKEFWSVVVTVIMFYFYLIISDNVFLLTLKNKEPMAVEL